ncbi:MAG: hypothetical protein FD155_1502 [Bacteroidetes bacterium]|nr:MAG: hypothetical protein FD155_1502 [Bacteroidota bacterium]
MEAKISKSDNYTLVAINGRIDTVTAVEFERVVTQVLEDESSAVVMDCAGLDYISSSGLRVFLMMQKRMMSKKGKLHICCLRSNIQEIFDISGFSTIFQIFPDEQSAKP